MSAPAIQNPGRIFWLCFVIAMIDGFDTLVVSFIAPSFAAQWHLTASQVGQVFGIGLLGAAIGGIIGGRMADRLGRRKVLIGCVVLFASLTVVCAFAPSVGVLMALRFLAGLGLGGCIPAITALTAEAYVPERRAAMVTRMFLGFPIGAVAGGALCALIVESWGWRPPFFIGGALGLLMVPFLIKGLVEATETSRTTAHGHPGTEGLASLLRGPLAFPAASLWMAAFCILLVSYFLINWTPLILVEAGLPEQQAIEGGVVLNLGGILGAITLTWIVKRHSPFHTTAVILLAGAVLIVLMGQGLGSPALGLLMVAVVGATVIGGQMVLPALASTLFPQSVRAAGIGLTMGIGRGGSIVGPTIGGVLIDGQLEWATLFMLVAIPTAIAAAGIGFAGAGMRRQAAALEKPAV